MHNAIATTEDATLNTTTAHDLAAQIATDHGVDTDFAAEAVESYVALVENLDGREIDRDAIDNLDAGFIMMAVAVDQHAAKAN